MIAPLRRFWTRSIRRQLMLGIALVHAVLMTLFVFDLVNRQRQFLHAQAVQQSLSLAQTLASNSTHWVLSNDLVGLEEVLQSLAGYPELRYAMVLTPEGKVLGHSRPGIAGKYLHDPVSQRLLVAGPAAQVLLDQSGVIDTAAPILRDEQMVGWARLSLGQQQSAEGLRLVTREGVLYTLSAIAIGVLFALFMARGLTRGLRRLVEGAEAVRQGRRDLRVALDRTDEIGQLGQGFNRMVEALAEQERGLRRLDQAVTQATVTVVMTDTAGNIEYVNPCFTLTTGYSRDEAIGRNPRILKSGHTSPQEYERLWQAITAGRTWSGEFNNRRKDGTCYWEHAVISPLLEPDGTITGYLAVKENITELKEAGEELERHRRHLEELVAERTLQLQREIDERRAAEKALIQAREHAEAANRAKSAFLANMSHELRTPLNAILGFSQLMEREPGLSVPHRRNLGSINHSGRHLLELINDILEISRIESGRLTFEPAPFDLEETVRVIGEMIRVRADDKGLDFRLEQNGAIPRRVVGDAHRLRQVLLNLLGNAVKYTDQGSVVLGLSAQEEGRLLFEVRDTGPGIPEADQARIFQPFYQTAVGVARGEGTGLGLAISREYAQLMGGTLTVESAPGKGSRFRFMVPLPLSEAELAPSDVLPRVMGIEPGTPVPRVLAVDDRADNLQFLLALLESVGIEVRGARDGEEAVALFQSWHPHLIWMDMRMPGMDGYQATRRIRELPGGNEVRIVALTASAFREDRGAILAAGCDEVLSKPFQERQLFDLMGRLLGLRYRHEAVEDGADAGAAKAWPATLPSLPAALRERLAAASEALDGDGVQAVVEEIRAFDPPAAALIEGQLEEFRFDRILALCSAAADDPDQGPPAN